VIGFEAIVNSMASGFLLGGILALTALGLSIVLGVMRLVNLAHGVFLIAGAYVGFFLLQATGVDPLLALVPIGILIAILAMPIQRFMLEPLAKYGPEAPMMTTFGLAIVLENLFVLYFSADTRSIERDYATVPLVIGPVSVPLVYVIGFGISVCLILAVHYLVSRTGFGRDLRASAVDPGAAAAVGVDVRRVHSLTFALGAACAAVGGTLIGIIFSFTPASGANYLLTDFAIVVLGGMGNILGTLVGGILLGILQSLAGVTLGDGYRDLVGLVLFLAVLAVRQQGLYRGHAA
jgi:branched-chain amino acid transport system permease protein